MTVPPYLRKEHARLTPQALVSAKAGRWFEIKAAIDGAAEILIYDEIGGWGIMAADFVRELQSLDASTVNVRISSPGGSVFEALAIYASLKNFAGTVHTIVDGLCASAATVVAMAGETVTTAPGSMWMVHDAWGTAVGNCDDMESMRSLLDKTSANMAEIYASRAGGTAAEWRTTMKAETWYTAEEAVAAKLADALTQATKTDASARTGTRVTAAAPVAVVPAPAPPEQPIDFAALLRGAFDQKEAVS